MKIFLYKQLIIILLTSFLLISCSNRDSNILNIYACGGYIPNDLVDKFTKETGIKINLVEYDSNETMFARLKSTKSSEYDIIIPSNQYVERMALSDMLHKIDKSKISSFSNLNKYLLNREFDPGNNYSVPYFWGTVGIVVNTKYINKQDIKRWQDLWSPKFYDQLIILNDMYDVFSIALLSLGYKINDYDPSHVEQAYIKLTKLLPNIKIFSTDAVPNIYIDEDGIIGMLWSGEYMLAKAENQNLHYIYPAEGFPVWIDSFVILKSSVHVENAYKFIDFILRTENSKQAMLAVGFSCSNENSIKLMPKNYINDRVLNPSSDILKKGSVNRNLPPKIRKMYEQYWEKLKVSGC